jgi:hypothetical protein
MGKRSHVRKKHGGDGMSLKWHVEVTIEELGPMSAEQILPTCPEYSIDQVRAALRNAAAAGCIHRVGKMGRRAIYAIGPGPEYKPKTVPLGVNSVWQLGSRA